MKEFDDSPNFSSGSAPSRRLPIWAPLLGVGLLVVGVMTVNQASQSGALARQFGAMQRDTAALRVQISEYDEQSQKEIAAIRDQMEQGRTQTAASVARSQSAVTRHADQAVNQLSKKQAEQDEQARQIAEQLEQVKESASTASSDIENVSTKVADVSTRVESVRADVDSTRSDLRSARGDLGEMSGLIATNADQIKYLRSMGDRNIYEFTLTRKDGLQRVGDIQVILKKADPKHSRFTLDVQADDHRVEKKDRTINEPVQFYTSKANRPYELVVNQVAKDQVKGYLATPKVTAALNAMPRASGAAQ